MKVLLATSEAVPLAKTGGLADVAGALPKAVHDLGHRTGVIMPLHRKVWDSDQRIVDTGRRTRRDRTPLLVYPGIFRPAGACLWRERVGSRRVC